MKKEQKEFNQLQLLADCQNEKFDVQVRNASNGYAVRHKMIGHKPVIETLSFEGLRDLTRVMGMSLEVMRQMNQGLEMVA